MKKKLTKDKNMDLCFEEKRQIMTERFLCNLLMLKD